MTGKYEPLELFLRATPRSNDRVSISFAEIIALLGTTLPESAYSHRPWWGNQHDSKSRPQAHAWLSAGFKVESVNQSRSVGSVTFVRRHEAQPGSS